MPLRQFIQRLPAAGRQRAQRGDFGWVQRNLFVAMRSQCEPAEAFAHAGFAQRQFSKIEVDGFARFDQYRGAAAYLQGDFRESKTRQRKRRWCKDASSAWRFDQSTGALILPIIRNAQRYPGPTNLLADVLHEKHWIPALITGAQTNNPAAFDEEPPQVPG